MPNVQGEAKKKFPGLFGGGGDDDGDEADDGEEVADDEEAAPAEDDGGYDLKACANDMMAAFKSGDVDALEEALQGLVDKVKG